MQVCGEQVRCAWGEHADQEPHNAKRGVGAHTQSPKLTTSRLGRRMGGSAMSGARAGSGAATCCFLGALRGWRS